METFFRVRKVVVCLLFIVFGLWVIDATAQYIDLSGGDVMELSVCKANGKTYACATVLSEENTYFVLLDKKGAYAIYQVEGERFLFLWCREAV